MYYIRVTWLLHNVCMSTIRQAASEHSAAWRGSWQASLLFRPISVFSHLTDNFIGVRRPAQGHLLSTGSLPTREHEAVSRLLRCDKPRDNNIYELDTHSRPLMSATGWPYTVASSASPQQIQVALICRHGLYKCIGWWWGGKFFPPRPNNVTDIKQVTLPSWTNAVRASNVWTC